MDSHREDDGVGPVEEQVREKGKELDRLKTLLRRAHDERAAGRAEELHAEIARRLGEIERLIND